MDVDKSARKAVVTGASGGIGQEIARALARSGCDCLLAARDKEKLAALAQNIAAEHGRSATFCAVDLSTLAGCERLRDQVKEEGGLDILVNCAGATRGGPFLELDDAAWESGFALKFYSAVRLARLLWPMLKERHGFVVNISGGAARIPDPDFAIGGAVNAALANFGKALAGLGIRDDVNVNTVHPGMTVTPRLEKLITTRAEGAGKSYDEMLRQQIEANGARRLGTPQDVANLVVFLCSPESRHIQGVAVAVDGGASRAVF